MLAAHLSADATVRVPPDAEATVRVPANAEATVRVPANAEATVRVPASTDSGTVSAGNEATARVPAPRKQPPAKAGKERRRDKNGCAQLRAEADELTATAAAVAAAAVAALSDAQAAHQSFLEAQQAAEDARRAYDEMIREAAEAVTKLAALERENTPVQQVQERTTTHAAFAAYRRGDISSEELREVFRRAEGWTPEHDRLSHRVSELRAAEADKARLWDSAQLTAEVAAEHARTTAVSARALEDESRIAALDARARTAAADACEGRGRRR